MDNPESIREKRRLRERKEKRKQDPQLSTSDEEIKWKVRRRVLSVEEEDRMIGSNNYILYGSECFSMAWKIREDFLKILVKLSHRLEQVSFGLGLRMDHILLKYSPHTRTHAP